MTRISKNKKNIIGWYNSAIILEIKLQTILLTEYLNTCISWLSSLRPLMINSRISNECFDSTATLMIGVAIALISVNGGQVKVVEKVALFKIFCSILPAPNKESLIHIK